VPFRSIDQCQIVQQPEVSDWRATLDRLHAERVYTLSADPHRFWHDRELQLTGAAEDRVNAASARFTGFPGPAGLPAAGPFESLSPGFGASDISALSAAANDPNEASGDPYHAGKLQDDLARGLFDAVQLTFDLSCPTPIERPYLIAVTDYRDADPSPTVRRRICVMQLSAIGMSPRKVSMTIAGFPPGFALVRARVHLYQDDREIATNASEPRVAMSRSEMFHYLEVQYMAGHKGRTLPPVEIRGHSQVTVRDKVDPEQLDQTIEVKVSREGEVVDWSAVNSGSVAVSVPVNDFLRDLHFYPALVNGLPVDGTVRARLSDLAQ
jgi:hypothetical protein